MRKAQLLCLALSLALLFSNSCGRFSAPDDAAVATDIKAKMFSEPALKNSSIEVSSHDGVVTLSGQVTDDSARLAAYKLASETKGVKRVDDQMTVQAAAAQPTETASPVDNPATVEPARKPASRPSPAKSSKAAGTTPNHSSSAPSAPLAPASAPPAATPPPPQPVTVVVPASSIITVRTIDSIDSATNKTGETFRASIDAPIVVDDKVIVPSGSDATLKLVNASSAGRMTGRSELTLALSNIQFQGKTYNVATSDVKQSGASRGKRTAATIGGGAALGALIGGLAGGGKGAAIGAAVGGGAGTGVQVFTKGQQVKIPSETRLDFTLEQPLEIAYSPGKKARTHSSTAPAATTDASVPDSSSDRPPQN